MNRLLSSDRARRAAWTFVQAFAGVGAVVAASTASGTVDVNALTAALVVSVGAGIAAVLSLAKSWAAEALQTPKE